MQPRGMELVGGAKRQCLLCIVRAECTVCTTDRCIDKEIERERERKKGPHARGHDGLLVSYRQ